MPGTNLTREEAQQRAKLLTVDSYEIDLDLSGAQEGGTFRSVTTVRFDSAEAGAESFIDLIADAVHEVVLNGRSLDVAAVFRDSRIALAHLESGPNELRIVADCAYTNTGEGLHRFVDPVDQQAYLYTQFEVPDARRVFANFEQPDLKGTFQFTVKAPTGWTVISNSATPEPKDDVWHFEPTPRMSSYITALIVGPYHSVHSSYDNPETGQSVPLGIYCRPSLAEYLDSDAIFEVTRQGFAWFQEKFDYAYPFAKYDQLFVPEFNAGAMENAGAVTIRDQYVFRSKVTDAAYEVRAETILHELAHMWFGDLVTMEWWNDLWLNESFATYTSIACQAYAPDSKWPHSWTTFANSMKTWAYRQDQLPSTHPIMAEINDLDDVLVNFDGITYAKGASVLKQLVAYVGMDEFFQGVQAYFKRHAFGNTRLSDLLGALEETSGRDLKSWSKAWLETAGINILRPEIETDEHGVITSFAIRQEAPALPAGAKGEPTLRPHRIAVGFYDLDDASGKLVRGERVELDVTAGESTQVPQLVGKHRPAVVLLNDDDLSYAKVRLDEESLAFVTQHLGDFEASLPRALCWASAWDMTRDAELSASAYLDLVLSGVAKESDIGVVQSLQRQVKLALDLYAAPAHRDALLTRWTEATLTHLRTSAPGSDHQLAWARAFAATARTPEQLDVLDALLEGSQTIEGLAVDTELRWAFVQRLAAVGRFDETEITAEYELDRTAAGERHAATARAARPTPEAKAEAWASVVESDQLPNAVQEAVIGGFVQTDQRELLAPYTEKYFSALKDVWDSRSHEMAQQIAVGLFPSVQVSEETLAATNAWLDSAQPSAALARLVSESRAGVERALKAQGADA
ncbi:MULTISPECIES: aminopeptidase N [unclassified Streptomyces]|uniref:aminopeptidase N n=1 Tax=unclassified Streptomyces TaxID=2593676 RepID=UPI000DBA54B4|nr:aminopeptidase N [Streptomyces sp. PsTaAH-137]MYT71309.1 aminopeptidase N [Streptomyces sp. SID8367]RAJ82763.1 aminopeptidase N [Streptomyces sp. PsTaAH-137]